jgi:hypothetical protein
MSRIGREQEWIEVGTVSPVPGGMPLLASGSHLDESDGACLMEFASILAGERFSDRPRCSDPVLADLVRAVNDEMSTDGRQQLAMTAPVLVGLVGDDRIAPAVVAAAADVALTRTPPSRWSAWRLRGQERRARARLARKSPPGPSVRRSAVARLRRRTVSVLYARGPANHAVTRAVSALASAPRPERDRALGAALTAALGAALLLDGPGQHAGDEVALQEEVQDHHR